MSRSTALKIAAVLSFVLGVVALIAIVPTLGRGAEAIAAAGDSPPYLILLFAGIFSVVRLVSAFWVWLGRRWAILLTILVNALDALAAVPGVLFAPTQLLRMSALLTVLFGVAIVVLCLWRDPKRS